MQILCHSQSEDKVVLQLNETDLQNIERARKTAAGLAGGQKLKTALDEAATALGHLNLHHERSRAYTGAMPVRVARNVIVLAACSHACLTAADWEKLIE